MKKPLLFLLVVLINSVTYAQDFEILFTRQFKNNDNLHVLNLKGEKSQLTRHNRKDSSPAMSPDGNHIVFTSERVGWWKIWLLDLRTNKFKQLTHSNGADYNPVWSPDGNQLLFVSGRNGNSSLFLIDKDGKNLRQLTSNQTSDVMPSWGGNDKIHYSSKIEGTYQIVQINPDGSKQTQLTFSAGDKLMPQLSPDGRKLVYYGNKDGNFDIYTAESNGKSPKKLTTSQLGDIRPKWSPDGKYIVFERGDKKTNQHIYLMKADGTAQIKLTSQGYNYSPAFVTKGESLLGK